MFEKFGEFDSAEELNMTAEGLLKEGDLNSIYELAKENGIEREDAQDYIDDMAEELATNLMAALGKIDVECKELKPKELMCDWIDYIRMQCQDSQTMCAAVRRKGKSIKAV